MSSLHYLPGNGSMNCLIIESDRYLYPFLLRGEA